MMSLRPSRLEIIRCTFSCEADATAVDCVTYAFWSRYRPEAAARTRVLAQTPPSPAIPFVTSATTPPEIVARLREALRRVVHEPCFAASRAETKEKLIAYLHEIDALRVDEDGAGGRTLS